MQSTLHLVFYLMALVSCAWCIVTLENYGVGVGDDKLEKGSNPAVMLDLDDTYTFFGEEYDQLWISDNGYVTFGEAMRSNDPRPFPITTGSYISQKAKMVAPYWSDVDNRCGGDIWYRQVSDLQQSEPLLYFNIIVDVYRLFTFIPKSAVVVTWEHVTCQNDVPCSNTAKNTVQLEIATDGSTTVVLFRYRSLEWQTSDMHRGPAWAGVNCGDRKNGFNVTSNVDDMLNMRLVSMSNCGYPGLFIYRVDLGPSERERARLMNEMVQFSMAGTMEFGVAEAEVYSPNEDVPASEFNRHEVAHHEEYVGGLVASSQAISFYYYGHPKDSDLGKSDESNSGKVYFDKPVYFYGKVYTSAVVNTNGFLTLGDCCDCPTYVPGDLTTTKVPIVAPFFTDVDTRGKKSGMVYYRGTMDTDILASLKTTVATAFPGSSFTPEYAFIATWNKVGYYNKHDDKLNSFQVVIATDSKISYVIINYKNVEWTSPDSTGVPLGVGVGAVSNKLPVMGIGDGHSQQQLVDGSQMDEQKILDVEKRPGNTGMPGLWIFEASGSARPVTPNRQYTDPKLNTLLHDGSAEQQAKKDIDSLASELQDAKLNHYHG